MSQDHSQKFQALTGCVVARCWSEGYIAPVPWVQWLLTLDIENRARRHGTTCAQAESEMTSDQAVALADDLVRDMKTDR